MPLLLCLQLRCGFSGLLFDFSRLRRDRLRHLLKGFTMRTYLVFLEGDSSGCVDYYGEHHDAVLVIVTDDIQKVIDNLSFMNETVIGFWSPGHKGKYGMGVHMTKEEFRKSMASCMSGPVFRYYPERSVLNPNHMVKIDNLPLLD